MTTNRKILIAIGVVVLLGAATALSLARDRNDGVEVRLEEVQRRDLVSTVTASGNIRARRTVDISSDISARVAELLVREGEDVQAGQVLLRLDPSQYEAAGSRAEAGLSQARAQAATQRANHLKARRDYDRLQALFERDSALVSAQQLEEAGTALDVAAANLEAAEFGVRQAEASLDEAEDRLSKTVIRAPMSGKVTRLNVEEGETVIIGTMNNPGSLVLTISDLSTVEVVVRVDETDVPELALGDSAGVDIDAFPDTDFSGRVTEIGNSAITPPAASAGTGQQTAIDFEVVITLDETPVVLRPDLSATAEIVTDQRKNALSVPIIALTIREPDGDDQEADGDGAGGAEEPAGTGEPVATDDPEDPDDGEAGEPAEVEGVFVVREGNATFVPVRIGITGQEHFEIVSGLEAGDTVVAGPYQAIRQLQSGDGVRQLEAGAEETSPGAGT